MQLINEITSNFTEWQCQKLDDLTTMHSQRFSGNIHQQLKSNFKSAYSLLSRNNYTIVISCFVNYTNVAVLIEN